MITHNSATQAEILQAQIEVLNSLDSRLQAKYEILTNMQQEFLGKVKEGQLASKKSGLRLAKEEIRRDLKELQLQLEGLENAEVTPQESLACEFAEFIADSKRHGYSKQLYEAMIRHKVKTTQELFQKFLKIREND
jgi:hypothetical protein